MAVMRTYFRIQGKHLTCSKRASYLGNTNWPDSPKLMKVLVAISLNRLSSLHNLHSILLSSCIIPVSPWKFQEYLIMVETEIYRFITLFFFKKKNTEITTMNCKIYREKLCERLTTMVGQRRKLCFLEPLKHLLHHSVNISFWKR